MKMAAVSVSHCSAFSLSSDLKTTKLFFSPFLWFTNSSVSSFMLHIDN